MGLFLTFCLLALLAQLTAGLHSTSKLEAALDSQCELRKLYQTHKQTHLLTRPPHDEKIRFKLFEKEIEEIVKLRKDPLVTWDVGVHFMADLSAEEKDIMVGVNASQLHSSAGEVEVTLRAALIDPSKAIPAEFDKWREEHLVGEVRKQLKGSCWAHAATCVIQSVLSARTGYLDELSVQEMYDCSDDLRYVRYGGFITNGYDYVINGKRLGFDEDSNETPNVGGSGTTCPTYKRMRNALTEYKVTAWYQLPASPHDLMYHVTYTSPVSVIIGTKVDNLASYKGLKYTPRACDEVGDHSVVVVGYTPEAWVIKNSWGTNWGTDGYMNWDRAGMPCYLFQYMNVIYMEPRDPSDVDDKGSSWDWLWPFNWGSKKTAKVE